MASDNRRNHFRVNVLMPLKWHMLSESDSDMVKKGLGRSLLTLNYYPKTPSDKIPGNESLKKDDRTYYSLQLLNNKLDYIINMMLANSESASVSDRVVEISASGLKFTSADKIDSGVLLKIDMLIPGTSYFRMEFIAETLRIDKIDKGYLIAANIICIDEDAREFMIKMIYEKQRMDIRRDKIEREVNTND